MCLYLGIQFTFNPALSGLRANTMKKYFYFNGRKYMKSKFELGLESFSHYVLVFGILFFTIIALRLIFKF